MPAIVINIIKFIFIIEINIAAIPKNTARPPDVAIGASCNPRLFGIDMATGYLISISVIMNVIKKGYK